MSLDLVKPHLRCSCEDTRGSFVLRPLTSGLTLEADLRMPFRVSYFIKNFFILYGNIVDLWGFPGSLAGKESACNARDPGSIPGLGRSPGGGHGNPLQYSWAWRIPWTVQNSADYTNKVHIVKAMVFPVVMYGCESWTIKKAEHLRTDAFELWCWKRLLRVP